MMLFCKYFQFEVKDLFWVGVCVWFIGDCVKLDDCLVSLMDDLELMIVENDKCYFIVVINYGGWDEVICVVKWLVFEVEQG